MYKNDQGILTVEYDGLRGPVRATLPPSQPRDLPPIATSGPIALRVDPADDSNVMADCGT